MVATRLPRPPPAVEFGGRLVVALLAIGAFAPSLGDEPPQLDCSRLPDDQRPLCEALAACSERPSAAARQACFDAAYRDLPVDRQARGSATPTTVVDKAAERQKAVASQEAAGAPRTSATATPASAANGDEKRRRWFRWLRRKPRADPPTPPQPSGAKERALPTRFEAVAQAVWPHGRDWQTILLDNGLLLEGRSGPRSRVRVGDVVQVSVANTIGGERYRLTSPSRRTFEMARLTCDRPTGADARKCAAARGERPDAGW